MLLADVKEMINTWRLERQVKRMKRDAAQWYAIAIKQHAEGVQLQAAYPHIPDGHYLIQEAIWLQSYARSLWRTATARKG